jgi:hypothetical protein
MKHLIILIFATLAFTACKDKDKKEPAPAPTSTTGAPVQSNKQVSVKINGKLFSCTNCANTYKSGDLSGVNFREDGLNRFIFNITGFLVPGTYSLIPFGNPSFTYEKDGYYYRGNGSITITESDTSANGSLSLFKANFSCLTDTLNDTSYYAFDEGIINIKFQ